jgi:hypothetical protein
MNYADILLLRAVQRRSRPDSQIPPLSPDEATGLFLHGVTNTQS